MIEVPFSQVKEQHDTLEGFRIQNYGTGGELSTTFDELYYSWDQAFLPIGKIENYQIGVGLNNGTYQQWKESGFLLTPKLISENYNTFRNELFLNWLHRSETYGLGWLKEQILNNTSSPILLSDRRNLFPGDFIDGQHRSFLTPL